MAGGYSEVFKQKPGTDPGAFENDGQATSGMCSASNKVHSIQVFEAIVRAEVQHLIQRVRQIEGGTPIDFVAMIPIGRSDHPLVLNAFLEIAVTRLAILSNKRFRNRALSLLQSTFGC